MKVDAEHSRLRSMRNQPMQPGRYAAQLATHGDLDFMDGSMLEIHYEVCVVEDRNASLGFIKRILRGEAQS